MTSGVCSSGQNVGPAMTVDTGWQRNSNDVTTPKLPPPPRNAQNSSGFSSALAPDLVAVGEHDVGRDQVVDRQPVLARQVADAAAEREPADAGRRR